MKPVLSLNIFSTWSVLLFNFLSADTVTVKTSSGVVLGTTNISRGGSKYFSFLGIPYAKPPVDELRFQDPQEPDPWDGVLEAKKEANSCPQIEWVQKTVVGEEDCLYLNVFTPQLSNTSKIPVLVWIHGGGFLIGAGSLYGPDYIMRKRVVVVTINYRLGALGFLHIDDEKIPGNFGMKDQVAALRWVKNNIEAFGGDSNQVTIAGSSAGAACVHWHMYSSLSQGLFNRAISQSGTAMAIWAETPRQIAKKRGSAFATLLGCSFKSIGETVKCLQSVPAKLLVEVCGKFALWYFHPMSFSIVPERNERAFVRKSACQSEVLNSQVPWMIGFTSNEGGLDMAALTVNEGAGLSKLNEEYKQLFPILFMYNVHSGYDSFDKVSTVTKEIRQTYFENKPIDINSVENLKTLWMDAYTTYDHTESALRYKGPKYFYVYSHLNEHSHAELVQNATKPTGPVHCDDLISLFKMTYFPQELNLIDLTVSEFMVDLWTNFIITGNPNGVQPNVDWKPVAFDAIQYLDINKQPVMKTWYWKNRYLFWKNLDLRCAENVSSKREEL